MHKYYFLSGLIFFAFINLTIAQDFDVPLTVTDQAQNSITLWFGVDPLGTDGYDAGLDTLAPPPPPGGFDARLKMLGVDFLTDIRDNLITEKQFHLSYQPDIGADPIVLSWDSSHIDSLGTFFIVDDITGTLFDSLDMKTTNSLVITDPLILDKLRILVTPYPWVSNSPPELDPIPDQNMNEGETLNVPLNATDPDGDNITLSSPNLPSFGNLVDNGDGTGTITFTPDFTQSGVYPDIMVIATDDGSPVLADTSTFTLTVNNVNRPPDLDPVADQIMNEGETLDVPLNSTDPDGDNITLSSPNLPAFGNLVDNGDGTGTITFTPGFDDAGVYPDIMVIATDDGSPILADTSTFTLTVNNVNRPPDLDPIPDQTMNEGETLDVPLNSTDPDGDNITLSSLNLPSFGTLVDSGDGTGTITFTPGFDDAGVYPDIMVIATDDGSPVLADTSTFTLTVNNVNRPPELDPIVNQSMDEGETLDVPVIATDPDLDNITLTLENEPAAFTNFVDNGNGTGTITFTPGAGNSGVYPDIMVIATDDGLPTAEADTVLFTLSVGITIIQDPTNLTASALVENEVELNWTDNSDNEDGFIIEREIPTMSAFVVIDTVGTNVSAYTDTTVLDGERYNYRVKAYNAFTQSGYAGPVQVVTMLPAPSNLSAQVFESPWRVELNWIDNSDNESGFGIVRDSANTGFVDYDSVNANITAYTDSLVTPIELYIYKVYAFTADTVSDYSDTSQVIVPVELSSFTASLSGNSVNILWSTATELNNKGFEIERFSSSLAPGWEKIAFIEGNGTTTEENHYQYVDDFKYISVKGIVQYRLKQIDFDGTYEYSDVVEVNVDFTPKEYVLLQNYPNPFNPSTKIKYALPQSSKVNLTVYNAIGEVVSILVNKVQEEGFHETDFDASNLPSGIYFYRLVANENIQVKKMILLK